MDYGKYGKLEFRRKFFKLLGAEIFIRDIESQTEVGFIKMKAWKLKEDVRVFSDRTQETELFRIAARNVIDFGATYDVFDSLSNQLLFSLRRKGLRSTFVRDRWELVGPDGSAMGFIEETGSSLALIRRWVGLIPIVGGVADFVLMFIVQQYTIQVHSGDEFKTAGLITRRKNPLLVKMELDTGNAEIKADSRISFAATALLSVIDSTKN